MPQYEDAHRGKQIIITLPAGRLGALGVSRMPEPGQSFSMSGRLIARDVYGDPRDRNAEATFELVPERIAGGGQGGGRPRRSLEDGQKQREEFFRNLFEGDD